MSNCWILLNFSLDNLKVLAQVAKHFLDDVLILVKCLEDDFEG